MAFIEAMHRNKPNITYLLTLHMEQTFLLDMDLIMTQIGYIMVHGIDTVHVLHKWL